ncbi:MAG: UDP-forming cellulose synthase catalytic subunit [Symploca sp. SIO1C4]|uniref:Cellulose synthase catalytic subunit [UDP-forming] n=1 Tax=Symploca sp. SIO1C4 TaxID=2607765 RepID=A0A6B3N6Q4_9CYAN|nr:UDP-forming cellulose synthase catalytic subunit [Symploca sp. SIO1C4]NET03189.1 UDP-forming cellulose synthase catalytic subunit [Symploca sp. SIO2B6]
MSFSWFGSRSRSNHRQRPSVTFWLVDVLPQLFEQTLGSLGIKPLQLLIGLLLLLSVPLIVTPLKVWQQGLVALMLIFIGQLFVQAESRHSDQKTSEYLHLFLVWLSLVTTARYLYYRTSYTLNFDTWSNGISCLLLYGAELYAITTLVLAYFQTLKIQEREPVDLANFPQSQWFTVDVYIPTYNEDVEIVRKTILAALALDYPEDKKRVYVLDDGRAEKYKARRESLRQICQELGAILMTRDNNDHAKAGNINTAFGRTNGDLVLILDCDHMPSRQFLQHTVGFFFDPKVSFVQTPHWFYNPDPFERNLLTGGRTPVGNELFYKVLQKGNDFWNAAFFCGSAAVIRKKHIVQVGGIAVETVTEDCHTALRLHSLGYKSVYYDKIMIAGLAPEKFSSYVGQQVRWARGMAQILRLENPLLNPKLKLTIPQRICYFSATSHFFYGYPRLIYAIAPTLFLLFGIRPIEGLGLETLAYALPHILLSLNANYITYKEVRFSFWNEIFEFVMAFQAGYVTLMAIINPNLGSFNVTDKGLTVTKRSFDWESARGLVIVAALVLVSLISVPFWLLLRPEDAEAVIINGLWCIFNLLLLLAAILVALEQPQLRVAHRLPRRLGAIVHSLDQTWSGTTINISETGALIAVNSSLNLPEEVEVELVGDFGKRALLEARIIRATPVEGNLTHLAVDFVEPTQTQLDNLALVIYSDVKEWYSQKRQDVDRPLTSLQFLATSLSRALQEFQPASGSFNRVRKSVSVAAQIYWEGNFYPGEVTKIGVNGLRMELDGSAIYPTLERFKQEKPLVGLLLIQDATEPLPERFLSEVAAVEELPPLESSGEPIRTTALELKFPEKLKRQHIRRIKQLLNAMH